MKLSKKQQEDLASALYYAPGNCIFNEPTEADIKRYFDWSDKGIGKKQIEADMSLENRKNAGTSNAYSGFAKIYYGKRNRELMITMYLEDWGDTVNAWSFSDEPETVKAFLRRAMKKEAIV